MRLLVLGGTVFLGRHVVESARARGHVVTLFHRGVTNPGLFGDVESLHGDRDGDLSALAGRSWDAVIDTSASVPGRVESASRALAGSLGHYLYVSSISALADTSRPGLDESAPLAELPAGADTSAWTGETYGALKALCEQVLQATFPGRVTIVRPGLIGGPHDVSDRLTYWPRRVARGGAVLCPRADQPVQLIDVRDLADWCVRLLEARIEGTFLATGPREPLTFGPFLAACHRVTESSAEYLSVDDDFLLEQEVQPFVELPLWIPGDDVNLLSVDCRAALEVGLTYRPLEQTLEDTWRWDATRPPDTPVRAGLLPDREQELLGLWLDREASRS